jgi:glycosyl transferase family 25
MARHDIRLAIRVISLPSAESRRRVIEQYLSKIDMPWGFFEARRYISGSIENDDGIEISSHLDVGNVGCFLSHRSLWKEIKDLDVDYAIILEDDTVLIPSLDFPALFLLLRDLGIEVIRLTTHQIGAAITLARLGSLYGCLYRVTRPRYGLGTGGYALTPRAAAGFYRAASRIEVPIDLWLERFRNHRIPIYNLFPAAAIEIRSPSSIFPSFPGPTGFIDYAIKRLELALVDGFDQWKLSRIDTALRRRIDGLYPGMAVWPRSELRRKIRQLIRLNSKN